LRVKVVAGSCAADRRPQASLQDTLIGQYYTAYFNNRF
jgi:hypothetical protein